MAHIQMTGYTYLSQAYHPEKQGLEETNVSVFFQKFLC